MESAIDATRAQAVWGSHVSTIKWGSLMLAESASTADN